MKNKLLQKTLKKRAFFTAISLFVVLGSANAHISKVHAPWKVPANALNNKVPAPARISGVVTDETKLPLPGVSVRIKGTTIGVTTDVNGKYTIDAEKGATLVFTFIGYNTKEITVGARTEYNIQLLLNSKDLDEVVVVGYGTQKKVNLTGAVATISGAELQNRPVPNALAALQGVSPGVTITRSSGQPGSEGYGIRIRGFSSANTSNALVLVDGIEQDLGLISPDDIESISVLKDAAASAIYGARAASGVVLVTTKKGKSGKPIINVNGYYGLNITARQPQRLNSWDEQTLIDEARFNATGAR
jgi:TonB-dependent SusC/RagA subfamily outer membrane receptor